MKESQPNKTAFHECIAQIFHGVAKREGLRNPWHEQDNLENVVYKAVCYWNNKQTSVRRIRAHKDNEKNNVIYELGEPDNDVVQRYQLRPNRCPSCLLKLHICQSDTKAIDMHQNHHCNTTLLLALGQSLAELQSGCEPKPLPNPKCNGSFCLQLWECRFCFFITNKGEHFVHFCFFYFFWERCAGQGLSKICYPQCDCPRSNFQMAGNAA